LLNEVFDDTIEEAFKEGSREFTDLVEMYAPKGRFNELKEIIFKLHNEASATLYPYETLERLIVKEDTDVWKMPFIEYIIEYENNFLKDCLKEYRRLKVRLEGSELLKHCDEVNVKISFIESLLGSDFKGRMRLFEDIPKVDLKYGAKKFDPDTSALKDETSAIIKKEKEVLDKLKRSFHYTDVDSYAELIKKGFVTTNSIIKLLIRFMKDFDAAKRDEGIIDFNDMEHMALEILVKKENGRLMPTQTALSYRDYYDEVMIDEYQDSNDVQETILGIVSKESQSDIGNRFMVGDIKQSIYAFRLAKPEIFKEKCEKYSKNTDDKDVRINLSNNFRSREQVIDSVNFIFERIMKEEVGGVQYNEDERLHLGKKDYPYSEDNKTEILLFKKEDRKENDKGIGLSAVEFEAKMVAKRIKMLKESQKKVYDKKTDSLRPMEYSDIAILLRSTKGKDTIFQRVLKDEGIPAYVISKNGYYGASEVRLMLNFLAVLDNPRQDLSLLGVMHSFIGGFSENEIAKIRALSTKKRLIDSLYIYLLKGEDEELKGKIKNFCDEIDGFKDHSDHTSASDLLREIYEKYDYAVTVSSMPNGEQRLANVKLLIDTANEYEDQGMYGIHDFLKAVEKLRSQEVDMGEANILDENANVVRIMTIHKSKGLEYPVCFVSGLHTKFKGNSDKILFDDELGIGGEAFDLEKRIKGMSPLRNALQTKKAIAEKGEEIRVLYVALTRAREKLIMTGELDGEYEPVEDMGYVDLLNAQSFMDMIVPICLGEDSLFDIRIISSEEFEVSDIINNADKISRKAVLSGIEGEEDFKEFTYSKPLLDGLFVKTTVSELKKAAYLESEDGENTLYHGQEKSVLGSGKDNKDQNGGAKRGSAYHRVMELMDFADIYDGDITDNLRKHRDEMVEKLFIYKEDDELVDEKKILKFLQTDLAKRMSEASKRGTLYLEQPFVLSVAANEVREGFPSDERILVQGVIDVYFEENGKLVLMDYKTDRVDSEEELIARYKTQLDYYSQALSRLENKDVAEIYIYSFSLEKTIKITS